MSTPGGTSGGTSEHEDTYDDLAERLSSGAAGVRPTSAGLRRLDDLYLRERRRSARGTALLAAAAAVVVAVVGGVVVTLAHHSGTTVAPSSSSSSSSSGPPSAVADGSYRAAAFLAQEVGGESRGASIVYNAEPGVRMTSQFTWWPGERTGPGYLVGAAVERIGHDPARACHQAHGPRRCTADGAGGVLATARGAGAVPLDPAHRSRTLDASAAGAKVLTVTYFRPDGWAVSISVANVAADGSGVLTSRLPLDADQLTPVVEDDSWIPQ